jgi:endonuclease/exonuclease/phosphatase family metal-dependent hydrolase
MRTFKRLTKGSYAVYPGMHGKRKVDSENSIAWRRSSWRAVQKRMFTIPYFGGNKRAMPLVKLRNKKTGMTAWFANVHNPATTSTRRGNDGWRRKAILKEAELARRLHKTGLPVVLTGDMNEREKAFCPLTGKAPLKAARGGSHRDGRCRAHDPRYVDWIFGSRKISFTKYVEDRGRMDRRTSDHPVVVSTAHLDPADYPATR